MQSTETRALRDRLKVLATGLHPAIFRRRTREAELLQARADPQLGRGRAHGQGNHRARALQSAPAHMRGLHACARTRIAWRQPGPSATLT